MYQGYGQIPTNGHYRHGGDGVLGGFGQAVYVEPPYYDDGGLLRIHPGSLAAFTWSINTTTSSDPAKGATTVTLAGYTHTYQIEAVSVAGSPGDSWFDAFRQAGYAMLFRGKPAGQLTTKLTFVATMDPKAVAALASTAANNFILIDGPPVIIGSAKAYAGGRPPGTTPVPPTPGGGCPPGTVGFPPVCVPTSIPGSIPGTTTPGTIPGTNIPIPGTIPGTNIPIPGTIPGTVPPTQPPPQTQPKTVGAAMPGWVVPALIGVGVVSVFAIVLARKKRES